MMLHFVQGKSEGNTNEQIEALSKYFDIFTGSFNEKTDIIYCSTIDTMHESLILKRDTKKKLVVYCWDYYLWAHDGRHPGIWNWKTYANLLKMADIIFVPSNSQKLRLKELLGLDSIVVKTGIKEFTETDVKDNDFILDPVRYYPEENRTWAEEAAKELNIPIIHSEHKYTKEEFEKLVATCTFMTCAYREASTGGLTLMEGLAYGKPSLVSDSPYLGAKDYLGKYGVYFKYDSFEDLKNKMSDMWYNRIKYDPKETKEYLRQFTFEIMAKEIHKNICELYNN